MGLNTVYDYDYCFKWCYGTWLWVWYAHVLSVPSLFGRLKITIYRLIGEEIPWDFRVRGLCSASHLLGDCPTLTIQKIGGYKTTTKTSRGKRQLSSKSMIRFHIRQLCWCDVVSGYNWIDTFQDTKKTNPEFYLKLIKSLKVFYDIFFVPHFCSGSLFFLSRLMLLLATRICFLFSSNTHTKDESFGVLFFLSVSLKTQNDYGFSQLNRKWPKWINERFNLMKMEWTELKIGPIWFRFRFVSMGRSNERTNRKEKETEAAKQQMKKFRRNISKKTILFDEIFIFIFCGFFFFFHFFNTFSK